MKQTNEPRSLSDDELLRRLSGLVSQWRRVESDLIAHIAEVDERRLYAREACSSMFVCCAEVLHLSEHEAYERITAARAWRKYPMLLVMLGDGRLHLSGIGKLAPHLTEESWEGLLARAVHKTKRQIEELLVELSRKPDAPSVMRRLTDRSAPAPPLPRGELGPDRVTSEPSPKPSPPEVPVPSPVPPMVEPLSPSRYKIQFTASGELRGKLERLQALMHADLASVIEAAVTEKLERLEAKRYAETNSPRKNPRANRYLCKVALHPCRGAAVCSQARRRPCVAAPDPLRPSLTSSGDRGTTTKATGESFGPAAAWSL
jgi:hypothetical protein